MGLTHELIYPSHKKVLVTIFGRSSRQDWQSGIKSATTKNGSQQITKTPVIIAKVLAALRSRFTSNDSLWFWCAFFLGSISALALSLSLMVIPLLFASPFSGLACGEEVETSLEKFVVNSFVQGTAKLLLLPEAFRSARTTLFPGLCLIRFRATLKQEASLWRSESLALTLSLFHLSSFSRVPQWFFLFCLSLYKVYNMYEISSINNARLTLICRFNNFLSFRLLWRLLLIENLTSLSQTLIDQKS